MAHNLPTGTVTFLFTDIEGSTRIAQSLPSDEEAVAYALGGPTGGAPI